MDPTEGMSEEEAREYWRDYDLASDLLAGVWQTDKHGLNTINFLSSTTKPTEEEARLALRRVLERRHIPGDILEFIAMLFSPTKAITKRTYSSTYLLQKVVFKKHNQGHANPHRDEGIHRLVFEALYDWPNGVRGEGFRNKKTLHEAYEDVAEKIGLSADQVKKTVRKVGILNVRKLFAKVPSEK